MLVMGPLNVDEILISKEVKKLDIFDIWWYEMSNGTLKKGIHSFILLLEEMKCIICMRPLNADHGTSKCRYIFLYLFELKW